MKQVVLADEQKRSELFLATASEVAITPAAVEKDFWIVWSLHQLFNHSKWKNLLRFKGGTSLSKAYGAIQRFSEDIDLILDWRGLTSENPISGRTKTQQQKLNTQINKTAQELIANELLPDLVQVFSPLCQVEVDNHDLHCINIYYPAIFAAGYLRPVIRLEIGPLAAMLPMQECIIKSYVAIYFPQVFTTKGISVPTIKLERSFWEKITILHAEAHRPENKLMPSRYARHYYDVWCLAQHSQVKNFIKNKALLAEVVEFKQRFYPAAWASYNTATSTQLSLVPSAAHIKELKKDYQAMAEMIFGLAPSFDEIMSTLANLQSLIHKELSDA